MNSMKVNERTQQDKSQLKNSKSIFFKHKFSQFIVFAVACLCYANTLNGSFVFDDSEAVVNNPDVKEGTPLINAFRNDFWGTRLTNHHSHKSYRPLTILSFKFNRWLSGGLYPAGFHFINVILHGFVSVIAMQVAEFVLAGVNSKEEYSFASIFTALLFATHPVHTESVAAVVGRADLLCAICFFISFLQYVKAAQSSSEQWPLNSKLIISMCFSAIAMFCKEQGITVLGMCSMYDIAVVFQLNLNNVLKLKLNSFQKVVLPSLIWRHVYLLLTAFLLLATRWQVMGWSIPQFQEVDNPASFISNRLEKIMNYNYIYTLNTWLLVCPWWLCFDWSMGCVPLMTNVLDFRLVPVTIFWTLLGLIIYTIFFSANTKFGRSLLLSLSFVIIPFLPASNLFFRVGFVIAERNLYLPSLGYCLLVSIGLEKLWKKYQCYRSFILFGTVFVLAAFFSRCYQRNQEWHTEKELFISGLKVCPLNAKVHYNIAKNAADGGDVTVAILEYQEAIRLNPNYGQAMNNLANILKDKGQLEEAEKLLQKAISIRQDFAAAWMNLGIVQTHQNKYIDAEKSYLSALQYRQNYPDCYFNLGNLYLDQKRYDEAYQAWRNATALKPHHSVAWNNMVIMLDSTEQLEKAETVGYEALKILPNEPSVHFNLANALGKRGKYDMSEKHFLLAIQLKNNNPMYYTNLGVLYHRWKKYDKAEKCYKNALNIDPKTKSAQANLALLLNTTVKQLVPGT